MKNQIKCIDKTLLIPIVFYIITNIFMLFMDGLWWDDWVYLNTDNEYVKEQFENNGGYFSFILYDVIAHFVNWENISLVYRTISFILGLLNLAIAYLLLHQYLINRNAILWILLLVATSPLFSAKITMICTPYGLVALSFYIGCYFFNKYIKNGGTIHRVLSLLFFFLSLWIWYQAIVLIPCFVIITLIGVSHCNIKESVTKLICYLDFLLLPVLFWIYRFFFLLPQHTHVDYYKITFKSLLKLPLEMVHFPIQSIADYFYSIFSLYNNWILFFVVCFGSVVIYFLFHDRKSSKYDSDNVKRILFFCLTLSFVAILPPLLIGKSVPIIFSMNSRFQALYILPASVILYCIVDVLFKSKFRQMVLAFLVSSSFLLSFTMLLDFQKSWFKSLSICAIIREETLLQKKNTNIVFNDLTKKWGNYKNNTLSGYELNGISKMALRGDESHNYISVEDLSEIVLNNIDLKDIYNARNASNLQNYELLFSLNCIKSVYYDRVLYLSFLYYYDNELFYHKLSEMFEYNISKIESENFWKGRLCKQ